jgi:hypothetical protein
VDPIREDAGLRTGQAYSLDAAGVDRHRGQGHRDPLARREEHVHLASGRVGRDGLGELDQLVGGVAHGRNDHNHLITSLTRLDHSIRHGVDPLGVGDRGSAILLDDEWHNAGWSGRWGELP